MRLARPVRSVLLACALLLLAAPSALATNLDVSSATPGEITVTDTDNGTHDLTIDETVAGT